MVATAGQSKMNVDEPLLKRQFRENADRGLLVDSDSRRVYSYGEVVRSASSIASELHRRGISSGCRVLAVLENGSDALRFFLGVWLAGAELFVADPYRGSEILAEIHALVDADITVSSGPLRADGVDSCLLAEFLSSPLAPIADAFSLLDCLQSESAVLCTFTSGSTGAPKGVVHTLDNLIASAEAMRSHLDLLSGRVFLHNLPMSYMAGILNQFLLPVVSSGSVVIAERFGVASATRFWQVLRQYDVDTLWLIPTMVAMLLRLDKGGVGREFCRSHDVVACCGTAPVGKSLKTEFYERYGVHLLESYGLSETLFVSAESRTHTFEPTEGVGSLLEGVSVDFADDGEILVDVPWLAKTYVGAGLEESMDSRGRFRSGDLGNLDYSGNLVVTGRKKDLIIRGGANISPVRIERVLTEFHGVREVAVVGVPDPILGEKTVAFVVCSDGDVDLRIVAASVVDRLGKDHTVDEFRCVSDIPTNTNGKVDRISLRQSQSLGCNN